MAKKSSFLIYFEYIPVKLLLLFPRLFSFKANLKAARFLGKLAYYLVAPARKVAMINLNLAFGDSYNPEEKKKIIKNVFINMAYTAIELINFPRLDKQWFNEYVRLEGIENAETALKKNKGLIVCTAHLFNWEVAAAATAMHGIPVNAIVRLLDNPKLDDYVENFRRKKGVEIIPKQYALRQGLKALRRNEILAILVDQNAAVNGVFVPFFDIPASTTKGAAYIARASGAPLICGYQVRFSDGNHKVFFSEEIPMSGNIKEDTAKIMQFYESVVRKYPENYLWLHPRWKKRPPGEKGFYKGLRV